MKRNIRLVLVGAAVIVVGAWMWIEGGDRQLSLEETRLALGLSTPAGSGSKSASGLFAADGIASLAYSKPLPASQTKEQFEAEISERLKALGWIRASSPAGVKELQYLSTGGWLWQRGRQLVRVTLSYHPKTGRVAFYCLQRPTSFRENLSQRFARVNVVPSRTRTFSNGTVTFSSTP